MRHRPEPEQHGARCHLGTHRRLLRDDLIAIPEVAVGSYSRRPLPRDSTDLSTGQIQMERAVCLTLPWVKSVTAHMQETERSGRGSATGQDDAAHMPSSLCRT